MGDKWDVEEIRALMPVVAAEQEMNYIGYLSNEIDDKTLLLDLRIHVQQLQEHITELQASIKEQDRCIRCVIWGTLATVVVLVLTVRMFWM